MANSEKENMNNDNFITQESVEPNANDENKSTDIEVNKCNEPTNVDEINESKNRIQKKESLIINLDVQFENVKEKVIDIEEKCAEFQVIGNQRTPVTWVQYNQIYGKIFPHHQYDGGYGGAPLAYDHGSRNYFVKFVFTVLLVMLCITAAFAIIVMITPGFKQFYRQWGMFIIISNLVILIGMNYVMTCLECSRVPPCNFISLVIVVICTSNVVAAVTVRYKTIILVLALIATVITVAACMLLACTSFDFTTWYIYVMAVAMVFMAVSLVVSITMFSMGIRLKPLQLVMLFIGTLIQVVILIMELQMIIGGRAIEIGEDDYALAAFMLYTSIVDIFLHIVQMMGLMDH